MHYHHYEHFAQNIIFKFDQLTSRQRVTNVELFFPNISPSKVKRTFANDYNLKINIKTVSKVVSKWRESGTIHSLNKGHSGRTKHVRYEENIVILNEIIQENPSLSVRKQVSF